MTSTFGVPPGPTRRGVIRTAASLATGAGFGGVAAAAGGAPDAVPEARAAEPFWGEHQAGIATPAQRHSYFAAFDLATPRRADLVEMLRAWTAASAAMTTAQSAATTALAGARALAENAAVPALPPARLTLTFGFGRGLFVENGRDRYGLAKQRPPALVDLPPFRGDQLDPARTGGDLVIQACAEDPEVAFDAARRLTRLASGTAGLRWAQAAYLATPSEPGATPRNLLGFKDGTGNRPLAEANEMAAHVWVGDEGPSWMRGGSYLVVRRIRIALEHWERMPLAFQEQTIGRCKSSGAPLGGIREFDPLDLAAKENSGDPVIPESAHVRLAAPATNGGARILRRSYSYNDGANFTTERWPPWRQAVEFDAGLLFVCYQRDPRRGFIRIFDNLSKNDLLNEFTTHTGGGLFACPGGIGKGEFIGERLFRNG